MLGRPPSLPAWVKNLSCMIKLVVMDVSFSEQTKCYPSSCALTAGFEATGRDAHRGLRQEDSQGML